MRPGLPRRQTKTGAPGFTKIFLLSVQKSALRPAILSHLRDELSRQSAAAQHARDEAISEESQPENKWDTHSQEAAYLAEGQAKLAAEIESSLEAFATLELPDFGPNDPIALGAIVELEAEGQRSWYLVGPRAGGLEVEVEGRRILVLTPSSPLGRELIGKRIGETVLPAGPAGQKAQRIVAVE